MIKSVRIDKWLWAVRIFKTRSQASDACGKGRIFINNMPVKPGKHLTLNDSVRVFKPPVTHTFRVKGLPEKRIGAKLVKNYLEDHTPDEELQKLKRPGFPDFGFRDRGAGRPTKKERRIIDRFHEDME